MKIRNGFVSNSSSGSFIIHWRGRTMGKVWDIKKALSMVFSVYNYDEEKNDFGEWKDYDKHEKEKIDQIIKYTEINVDGSYTTRFFTTMVNTADDFGEAAKSLIINLLFHKDRFEIVDTQTIEDGW